MKTLNLIILVSFALVMVSCTPNREKLTEKIKSLEEEIGKDPSGEVLKAKGKEVVRLYEQFAVNFPEDTITPDYIFKAGVVCMNIGEAEKSIELFDQVLNTFPKHIRAPESIFFKAYVYENVLHNISKAREAYQELLSKYPLSDMVDDARFCIDNLGKTPEQIQQELEEKIKQQNDTIIPVDKG